MKKDKLTLILVLTLCGFVLNGLFFLCSPAAQAVSQIATNLVRYHAKESGGAYSQLSYGELGIVAGHGLDQATTVTTGGCETELSVDETELNGALISGLVTTVATDFPVIGDGSVGDPIDISTAIAGNGISMTTDYIDVNCGSGIYIDGSDNVAVGWNDGAGHTLSFDSDTLTADTTLTWADIVDGGYLKVATGGALSWDTSPDASVSLDDAYDVGAIVDYTEENGPIRFNVLRGTYDPGNFLIMTNEAVNVHSWQTNGDSNQGGGIFQIDYSENSVVINENLTVGDADSAGTFRVADGVGGYTELEYDDFGCCSLDESYDVDNTIDFTGASTAADAVILAATTADDPFYFLEMTMDTNPSYAFTTAGLFYMFGAAGTAHFFNSATGVAQFNDNGDSTGDLTWKSQYEIGLYCDASAETITVVHTEFIGDDDDQGNLYVSLGDGDYLATPNTAPGTYDGIWCVGSSSDLSGIYQGAWIGNRQHFFGQLQSGGGDGYIASGAVNYSAAVGDIMMRAGTIMGISACAAVVLDPGVPVGSVDIKVYVNGAYLTGAKQTITETDPSQYTTFTAGTYTFAAGDILSLYADFAVGTVAMNDLIVDVEYMTR